MPSEKFQKSYEDKAFEHHFIFPFFNEVYEEGASNVKTHILYVYVFHVIGINAEINHCCTIYMSLD